MKPNKGIRIFDGATALVTGGASGIGRALAEEMAKRGGEGETLRIPIIPGLAKRFQCEFHLLD